MKHQSFLTHGRHCSVYISQDDLPSNVCVVRIYIYTTKKKIREEHSFNEITQVFLMITKLKLNITNKSAAENRRRKLDTQNNVRDVKSQKKGCNCKNCNFTETAVFGSALK